MTAVLALALVLPLAAAVAHTLVPDPVSARRAAVAGLLGSAACWSLVARSHTDVDLGRVRPDALGPVIAVGVVLTGLALVGSGRDRSLLVAGALASASLLTALANLGEAPAGPFDPAGSPETAALTALVLVGMVAAVVVAVRLGSLLDTALLGAAGIAAAVSVVRADGDAVTTFPAVAAGLAVAFVAAGLGRPDRTAATLLLPVVLAVVARGTESGPVADQVEAIAVVLCAAAAAHALWVAVRDPQPAAAAAGALGLLSAAFLMMPSVDDARSAGLLLAAGAVLVSLSGHRASLVATGPAAIAAVVVLGRSDQTGALVLAGFGVVTAGALFLGSLADSEPGAGDAVAVAFAIVPVAWTWAAAPGLGDVARSLLLTAAAGGIGAGLGSLLHVRRAAGPVRAAGSLSRSRSAPSPPDPSNPP